MAEGWPDAYATVIAPLLEAAGAGRATRLFGFPVILHGPAGEPVERLFDTDWSPIRDETGVVVGALQTLTEVTEIRRAQKDLHENDERQTFLLRLSDALRPLSDVMETRAEACRLLGEQLSASRVYYVEYQQEMGYGVVAEDYLVAGLPSLSGRYPFEAFRTTYERIGDGRTWIVPDVGADRELPERERSFYAAQGVLAWVDVPLAKDGVLEAALCVVQTEPREWTALEISLAEETAERLWAAVRRGRIEAELRGSEERFAQFAASSSDGLWIRDAATLAMEYTSPAIQTIYGISPDAILGDLERWTALIVEEDRDSAREHLQQAVDGKAITHEFRIRRPGDGNMRWIRNTDFPLRDQHGRVRRIGGIAEDVTEARELQERQGVLVAELQHRTRNLMGVVRSMADRTMRGSVDLDDFRTRYSDRLSALARVQSLLARLSEGERITFDELIQAEMAALNGNAERVTLIGPAGVALRSSTVQTFALALHELATNAVKYGAFAQPQGRLEIRWHLEHAKDGRPWLYVDWRERGVVMPTASTAVQGGGAGRELIERALPYQLGARTTYVVGADGVHCTIALPASERQVA